MTPETLAQTLWDARMKGQPCKPPTELSPSLDVPEAYAVSRRIFSAVSTVSASLRGRSSW